MTNEEAKVLGLRAVAVGFMIERAPGAKVHTRRGVGRGLENGWVWVSDAKSRHLPKMPDDWPDFRDPATLGCLLALVRERFKAPGIHVRCMLPYAPDMSGKTPPPWVVHEGRGARLTQRHSTEAEALVAALEAAP